MASSTSPAHSGIVDSRGEGPPLPQSKSMDWLTHMIFTMKAMTAGTEFVPFPGIHGTFAIVLALLETVQVRWLPDFTTMVTQPSIQKVKRNQDDLKELCENVVAIASILRNEVAAHGATMAAEEEISGPHWDREVSRSCR
ncbi:hypothetical protein FB451DRAFT_1167845 [Mycena latifolia]|nr:hypothetical protein FB451DRAFT_1167845 [Mycena latifolia]